MVSKVLWVVPFPRCTAGPNIVSLVWIGNRLLILKEGQHLTRAWLTPKRTISWIPNKEAHNPTSRSKIFGESRFPGSCKISYPDKKSCIFRILHSILVNSRIPEIPSRPCLVVGDWSQWVLMNGRCSDAFALPFIFPQGSCLEPCYLRHFFKGYLQDFQSFADKALTLCVIRGSQLDSWNLDLLKPNLDFTNYS